VELVGLIRHSASFLKPIQFRRLSTLQQTYSKRFAIGITLPSVVAPATAVPRFECRQLAVAVGTDEPKVRANVIGCVSVDMVDDHCKRRTIPVALDSTDGAASALFHVEINADKMTLV
jgi:hypothetical protein